MANKILEVKVGSGFAFLLYEGLILFLAIWLKPPFEQVAIWLFAGLGFHSGQRATTQILAKRVEGKVNEALAQRGINGGKGNETNGND